jgi:hypothetical protein
MIVVRISVAETIGHDKIYEVGRIDTAGIRYPFPNRRIQELIFKISFDVFEAAFNFANSRLRVGSDCQIKYKIIFIF